MVKNITSENFESEVMQSDKPVVLDIFATWCGPCQQMAPVFEELATELGNTYKFAKLNVDESRDVAIKLGATSIPTFVFVKNGEIKGKEIGYMSKEDLLAKIEAHLK
jgi:thioredoxin 1